MANKAKAISYVGRGFSLARDYYKGNIARRIAGSLLLFVRILTLPFSFFAPAFAQSDFSFARMLHETGDANIGKSFDGVEEGKSYFAGFMFNLIIRLALLVWSAIIGGAGYGIYTAFLAAFPTVDVAMIYFILVTVILGVLYLAVAIPMLAILISGNFVAASNKALGLGDIMYNGFRCARENAAGIACLLIVNILLFILFVAPLPVAAYVITVLGYQDPSFLIASISLCLAIYILLGLLLLFYGGQVAHSFVFSFNAMLFDRYTSHGYVVTYAERKKGAKNPVVGKTIEILPLEDYEKHPLSTHEVQKED